MGRHHSMEDQFWEEVTKHAAHDAVLVDYLQRVIFQPASVADVEAYRVSDHLGAYYGLDVSDQERAVDLCRAQVMTEYYTIRQS